MQNIDPMNSAARSARRRHNRYKDVCRSHGRGRKDPSRRSPAKAFQDRPASSAANWLAPERQASEPAATLRYSTACKGNVADATRPRALAHRIQPLICFHPLFDVWFRRKTQQRPKPNPLSPHPLAIEHLLIGSFEHKLWRRENREACGMEFQLARPVWRIIVRSGKAFGLQILVAIAIERHSFPIAVQELCRVGI